ncbi:MAG: 4-hydroxy-tetrahydrodipicolinate synthase [Xanthomonadales bacterium]
MFEGSIVALVTPFTDQGEVDASALRRLVDFHLEQGTNGLLIAGTTGESVSLTSAEFTGILDLVVERLGGQIPVIAGTGNASTMRSVEQTQLAAAHGADAALLVTPYYVRPSQRGLEAHFMAIADESDIPVILYNVPSRTSVDLLPQTVERLSAHPRIVAIKEATGDPRRIDEILDRCDDFFVVLSGDDHSCLQAMKRGARGVISVAANVAPGRMAELCAVAHLQDWARADVLENELSRLFDILMIETNPIPVKWALFEMGLVGPHLRLPMTGLDEEYHERLRQCLHGLGLIPS